MRILYLHVLVVIVAPGAGLRPSSTRSCTATKSSPLDVTRRFVVGVVSVLLTTTASFDSIASAVTETVGKDPTCNDRTCLGVWDGLLADCPHDALPLASGGAGCVSSQDDTPGVFAEPWDYSEEDYLFKEDTEQLVMKKIVASIQLVSAKRKDQVRIVQQENRYLRVVFTDGRSQEQSIGEFYITPNDTTVQFRVTSLNTAGFGKSFTSLRNMDRAELIRKELRFLKLPVLRNRKRSLFFVESDLDTFGPGSAALGPPAEMKTGELDGRRQDVDPRLKIDFLQQFQTRNR
jgi:hypothetical protein